MICFTDVCAHFTFYVSELRAMVFPIFKNKKQQEFFKLVLLCTALLGSSMSSYISFVGWI